MREGLDALRNEVKSIVAISEKYIKDESKIESIKLLGKTIVKDSKYPIRSHENNPYFEKR